MSIAILGWGSLIWNTRDLPISGKWQQDGPVLPIEFSRISDNCRITFVIDERSGVDVTARYVLNPRRTQDAALNVNRNYSKKCRFAWDVDKEVDTEGENHD